MNWSEYIWRDIRHSFRALRKSPGFALSAVITLAVGIGTTTAMFSAVYSVLLKSVPYYRADEIYSVEVAVPERSNNTLPNRVQDYLEWRKATTAFSAVAALIPAEWDLTGGGEPERIGGARVSTNFFSFLGVPMARGRGFADEEQQPGKDKVVVISDALWRTRYASDREIVGRSINLDGVRYQIVGIASPTLLVPTGTLLHPLLSFSSRIDIWQPIAPTKEDLEGESWDYGVLVRLKSGASLEEGRLQLQSMLNQSIRAAAPEVKSELLTQLKPIHEVYSGNSRLRLLLIFAASLLLLVVACTNVVNLLLARAATRSAEIAVRITLGAAKSRILSHMLIESLMLAVVGGVAGIVVAAIGSNTLLRYSPEDVRLLSHSGLNWPVLGFAICVSVLCGLLCGILPARQAFRRDPGPILQEGAKTALGGGRTAKFQQILVGVETVLSTLLLASAGFLLHSFVKLMVADRGYEINHVMTADLRLSGPTYTTDQERTVFWQQLTRSLGAVSGMVAVGAINSLPALGESGITQTVFYPSDSDFQSTVLHRPVAAIRSVTPGYFSASGIQLLAGRVVSEMDQTPVAMISESLAKHLWPAESPARILGRSLRQGDVKGPLITIVGVVEDVRPASADRELPPQVYRPYQQLPDDRMTLVVRSFLDDATVATAVRSQVRRAEPNLPILSIQSMAQILLASVAQRMFQMILTGIFATVALILGAIGVYGVVSYAVACRTRDIGVRLALGSTSSAVMRWLFGAMFRFVVVGLIVGLGAAVLVARVFRTLLYGVAPSDPLSLGIVAFVLLLSSAIACYLPARRAARLNPITALRSV